MEDPDSGRASAAPWLAIDRRRLHRIGDPRQAVIVADPVRSRFLVRFLGRALTVTEAAREVGCDADTMLYRVRRMVAAGLLRVVATRARAGRPVKVYRSPHDGYFVPLDVMPYDDLRHRVSAQGRVLAGQLTDAYTAVLARTPECGRALGRTPAGEPWATDLMPESNHRGQPALLCDLTLALTRTEAEAVRGILAAAMNRARAASAPTPADPDRREPYLFAAVLLPMPE